MTGMDVWGIIGSFSSMPEQWPLSSVGSHRSRSSEGGGLGPHLLSVRGIIRGLDQERPWRSWLLALSCRISVSQAITSSIFTYLKGRETEWNSKIWFTPTHLRLCQIEDRSPKLSLELLCSWQSHCLSHLLPARVGIIRNLLSGLESDLCGQCCASVAPAF